MIIYSIIFLYVFIIGIVWNAYYTNRNFGVKSIREINIKVAICIWILPVFFIGMRTNYIDTAAYISSFEQLSLELSEVLNMAWDKGVGWGVYSWIIKSFITTNASVFLIITAIFQAGALIRLYYKYSAEYCYSVLLFFLSCSFVNMMNGIRQFTALCLIIYFVDWVFEKKYFRFLIVVCLAVLIHFSAIIWIPAVFLVQGKPWNWKMIIVSIMTVFIIVFVDKATGFLSNALVETSYAGYTNQFAYDDGSSFAHTVLAAVPVLLALLGKKNIIETKDKKIFVLINISITGMIISFIANFTSGILIGRMPIYFTVFNFALYPWLIQKVFTGRSARLVRVLCVAGYLAYAVFYMTHAWGSLGMPYISDVLNINTWN